MRNIRLPTLWIDNELIQVENYLKAVLKSLKSIFQKHLTFFSNMFYLKVGSVANKKMNKKVYVAVQNFAAAPHKAGHVHKFRLFYYMKKSKFSFN